MKPRTVVIVVGIVVFAVGLTYALLREVRREEAQLQRSVSGRVVVDEALYRRGVADIVKTDRLALFLVDPQTREAVALRFESPLVPPQAIRIGQEDAQGRSLSGAYILVGITDKDGEIFRSTPGEVYGRSSKPVALGSEAVELVLNEGFRGTLFNEQPSGQGPMTGGSETDATHSISGTARVADDLADRVRGDERLVVLLFDPEASRPVAFRIMDSVTFPQAFRIGVADADPSAAFELRILTDRDNDPFNAAPGEVIGRSSQPVPLGTEGLEFVLDEAYQR